MTEDRGRAQTASADDDDDDDEFEPSEEPPLTAEELAEFKALLVERKQELVDSVSRHVRSGTSGFEAGGDEMDEANRLSEQAYQLRLADKEQKLLNQIVGAIDKIERGEYGICEGTGDFIGRKRLRARPWAKYSIEYKSQLERDKGARRRTM